MIVWKIAKEEDYSSYESLAEFLDFEYDYNIEPSILQHFILSQNLYYRDFSFLLLIKENEEEFWFERVNGKYDYVSDIIQFIYDSDESKILNILGIEEENVYVLEMGTLQEIRESPGIVYHFTTEEKWSDIKKDGYMIGSRGTGLTNKVSYGIFTTTDPEEYATGTYGNVLLKIDLQSFKEENGLSQLNIELEPEWFETIIKNSLASKLQIEHEFENSNDTSPFTLIINHKIPVKYIERIY